MNKLIKYFGFSIFTLLILVNGCGVSNAVKGGVIAVSYTHLTLPTSDLV